ncbi:MAG: hypothetical protein DHS20C21_12830 [Gemmatimonadota bacterium]|nr:MAG: hypothetical protein DHS20C21_12830 [Gemmatimonadota bacterium]
MSHVIPKREVGVQIHTVSGDLLQGEVFLDFIDVIHRGEQTLLDKFNDDFDWLPLRSREGFTEIVNRDWIVSVEPARGLPLELVRKESGEVFRRELVLVRLASGRSIDGRLAMDLPDEFSRVSDFLNFPQNFFALETDDGPVLIAKRHVLNLRALEAPPAAPGGSESGFGETA